MSSATLRSSVFVLLVFTCSALLAESVDVWFGTTTPRNGLSKGIYHAVLNQETGKLSVPRLAYEISSPGFLAMHPRGGIIYSTGSVGGKPSVVALRISGTGAKKELQLIGSHEIGDGGAAHLSTDREGKLLLTAQYGGGSTAVFALNDEGGIEKRIRIAKHSGGSRVVPGRQDKPHAHWVGLSPDNRFAFVPDLGMDKVVIWRIDGQDIVEHGFGICPPGGGPRHMKFHTSGKYIYVLNELALSVTVFRYDSENGQMEPIQTIPTVPEADKKKERFVSASEIRMHPSGDFVYAANRGHDTITAFAIDSTTGKLTLIEREPVRGAWPRNFNIDPSGRWLIAAGRDSQTAAVFEIDQESGELAYPRNSIVLVPTPICVLFGQ